MRYYLIALLTIWLFVIPVAFFEGRLDSSTSYYLACVIEAFVFSIGVLVGLLEKKEKVKK